MTLEEIKKLLESSTYEFLRKDPHLGNRIMLLTLGGSHAYGTNLPSSDLDIRGIAAEGKEEIIGLSRFEQFENKETDTTIYSFRKIVDLMLNCNPNTIEILGTKPEHVFFINEEGKLLRDNSQLFLSKKASNSFGGYANQQLRRLQNALVHDSYPQPEKEVHILKTVQGHIEFLSEKYRKLTGSELKLYIDKSDKEDYETEIFMDIDLKKYSLHDFKNIYSEMYNIINEYGKLNKRNNKKDDIHLNKHAMHLVRLYLMGIEILEGKGINTYREKDIEFLMDIRNGKYSENNYKMLFEIVDEYETRFKYAKENSPLPEKPNYKKVEELVMEINMRLLKKYV